MNLYATIQWVNDNVLSLVQVCQVCDPGILSVPGLLALPTHCWVNNFAHFLKVKGSVVHMHDLNYTNNYNVGQVNELMSHIWVTNIAMHASVNVCK